MLSWFNYNTMHMGMVNVVVLYLFFLADVDYAWAYPPIRTGGCTSTGKLVILVLVSLVKCLYIIFICTCVGV